MPKMSRTASYVALFFFLPLVIIAILVNRADVFSAWPLALFNSVFILALGALAVAASVAWDELQDAVANRWRLSEAALPKAGNWYEESIRTPFCPRILDPGARALLSEVLVRGERATIVLHGEPSAGTRCIAAEVIADVLPEYKVFRPEGGPELARFLRRRSPRRAADALRSRFRAAGLILWLDELDFVRDRDGLRALGRILDEGTSTDIVTLLFLDTGHYAEARLNLLPEPSPRDPLHPIMASTASLLGRAIPIEVKRVDPDWRTGSDSPEWRALAAWHGQLSARSRLAAMIVDACADWRRMGLPAISRQDLRAVCAGRRSEFSRSLKIAQEKAHGVQVVRRQFGRYRVATSFFRMRAGLHLDIPDTTWTEAIARCRATDAFGVGTAARSMFRYAHAERAFEKADKSGVPGAAFLRAVLAGEAGRIQDATTLLDRSLDTPLDGPPGGGTDPGGLLAIRLLWASLQRESGDHRPAIRELSALLDGHGPETRAGRAIRHELYRCQLGQGRDITAVLVDLARLERQEEHSGDIASLLAIRHTMASWTARKNGDIGSRIRWLQSAVAMFERLVEDYEAAAGEGHPMSLPARNDLARARAELAKAKDDRHALQAVVDEMRALAERAADQLGRRHLRTLETRGNLGWGLAASGQVTEAIRLLRELRADCLDTVGPAHRRTRVTRKDLAAWLIRQPGGRGKPGEPANLDTALEELAELVRTGEVYLGEDHPETLSAKREYALLQGHRDPDLACFSLGEILSAQLRTLDARSAEIRHTREVLERCAATRMVHLAITPLYRSAQQVVGYEIRFRSVADTESATRRDVAATSSVIVNTFTAFDITALTDDFDIFVNVTEEFIVGTLRVAVSPARVVLQIPDTLSMDTRTVLGIKRLKSDGYRVAIVARRWSAAHTTVLPYLSYVKIEVDETAEEMARRIAGDCQESSDVILIGAGISDHSRLELARTYGCRLFQGSYFARPLVLSRKALPSSAASRIALVGALTDIEHADMWEVISTVENDPDLSSKVVQWCNSARAGLPQPVSSVGDAVVLMGLEELRDLAALAAMETLPGSNEGARVSMLTWSRMCRTVAEQRGASGGKAFLAGLIAEIARYLERPVAEIAAEHNLTGELVEAVVRHAGPLGEVLTVVEAYKSGSAHRSTPVLSNATLRTLHMDAFVQCAQMSRMS